jgi:peptidoglycan/xylan/chitin deacetylase (PgdA/CDA1 family)
MSRFLSGINQAQRYISSHVLLYHATFREVPKSLDRGLHNVHPEVLYRQLGWLKRHFDIVDVESLLARPRAGAFAITFDDAYACVFDEALPLLQELGLCCTVFVNGVTLSGRPFWRDKIRYIINHDLTGAFVDHYEEMYGKSSPELRHSLYRASKDPRIANSARIDGALEHFFSKAHKHIEHMAYCAKESDLVGSPLVKYGNHSFNHYVLSSLSVAEQEKEICENERLLHSLGVDISRVFSVPFGGERDFNEDTIKILKGIGYCGFLYSRNRLNIGSPWRTGQFVHRAYNFPYLDRYMVPSGYGEFQRGLTRMAFVR